MLYSMPLVAGMYGFMGLIFAVVPFFAPRNLVSYLFHGTLIAASMVGCCTIPFAAALLVAWLRPETQSYFIARS